MTYITGSITDANPGPALHALMAPALTAAGFTLVDTVVISTRTHKVWKSPAAGNAQNLDWYLDVAYTTSGAGTMTLVAFEMFDPATDLGYRGPYVAAVSTIDATTSSRFGATGQALESQWLSAASVGIQTALTTSAFGYWISITADRVILLSSGAPSALMYAGFYQPDPLYAAKAAASMYPLYTGLVGGTSAAGSAGVTRIAPWTTLSVGDWSTTVTSSLQMPAVLAGYPRVPAGPATSYPFSAVPSSIVSPSANIPIGRYGSFRDVFLVPATTVARGDTCTISGSPYVFATSASNVAAVFKAA